MSLTMEAGWPIKYGSSGNDVAWDIKEDQSGNYVVVGSAAKDDLTLQGQTTNPSQLDGGDIWVLKITNAGTILDQELFYGSYSGPDYAKSVIIDCDGNYVIGSFCNSCESIDNTQSYLLKLDNNLGILYSNTFGNSITPSDQGSNHVLQPYSGTYGTCESDDPILSLGISHTPGGCLGPDHDFWTQKSNGDLTNISGFSNGCPDVSQGAVYGGTDGDNGFSAVQTCDGYLLAGFIKSGSLSGDVDCNNDNYSPYTEDMWLAYVNKTSGVIAWDATLGDASTANSGNDGIHSIKRCPDGSYIALGYGSAPPTNNGGSDLKIVKFELTDPCPAPVGLAVTTNQYCATLFWRMDPCVPRYLVEYRKSGGSWLPIDFATSPVTINTYNPCPGGSYEWKVTAYCSPNNSAFTSSTFTITPCCDGYVESCTLCIHAGKSSETNVTELLSVHPNPSGGLFTITLQLSSEINDLAAIELFDHLNQRVSLTKSVIADGLLKEQVIVNHLPAGIYSISVTSQGRAYRSMLILQKD